MTTPEGLLDGAESRILGQESNQRGVFWGVLVAFVVGVPLFVYGNIVDRPAWIVGASLFIIAVSTGFCLLFPKRTEATHA